MRGSVYIKSDKNNLNRDIQWCQNLFLKNSDGLVSHGGIHCKKINYSDNQSKNVNLWFNAEFTKILYKGEKNVMSSTIKISDIIGLIYGPFSSTFYQKQDYILNYEKF